jgi:hypothetical protein
LVPYELKNVASNLLQQKTSPEFVEWVSEQDFQLDTLYDNKVLFEDFKNKYLGDDTNFKQRGFTNWLKFYATTKHILFKNRTSNGSPQFCFVQN